MDNQTKKENRIIYRAIAITVGFVIIVLLSSSFVYWVKRVNGTTKAQIEARERALEACEQSTMELQKQGQWYIDMLHQTSSDDNYRENEE